MEGSYPKSLLISAYIFHVVDDGAFQGRRHKLCMHLTKLDIPKDTEMDFSPLKN